MIHFSQVVTFVRRNYLRKLDPSASTATTNSPVQRYPNPPSRRRSYLAWVEEQIESFKESVSRSDLLGVADEVVADLRVNSSGQYQLTEVLLAEAVDRKIFRMLKLPTYRSWAAEHPAPGVSTPAETDERPVCLPEAASF